MKKIEREDKNGSFLIHDHQDVEYVNPVKYYSDITIESRISILKETTKSTYEKLGIPDDIAEKVITKEVINGWEKDYQDIIKTSVPDNLFKLFGNSKKEQIKLLKGIKLTADSLGAYVFKAYTDHGYTFSQYKAEHYGKDVDKNKMPKLVYVENGKVEKVGETEYSDGKLKQIIDQRKVVVAKVFDKGDEWHCFIVTYDSLKGKESWKDGQPHLHYISSSWGISREELVSSIKSGNYKSTPVHIEYNGHRNN